MKENGIFLLQFTSVRSLDYLLKNLNEAYVTSGVRKGVNRLLGKLIELTTNEQEKNEAILLQHYFSKPTTKNGYIDKKTREKACALLQDMRNVVEFSSSVEKLSETISTLRIDNSNNSSTQISRIYFRQLLIEDDFIPEFAEILDHLQITQYQIKKTTSQILLFGVLKDESFWKRFEELWRKHSLSLPPYDDTKICFLYYGGSQVPFPNPEDQYLISGDCLNSYDSCFDPLVNQIPGKLDSFNGTIGGFIIDDNKQIYAITAAHVVSNLSKITTSKLVYCGNYDQHYLDVAFLPLKKDMPPSRLRNFLGCSDDPGVYTEYWTEYLEEFPRAANPVYPPGSKVLKVGLETGFSEGWLLDMNACPKVADQRDPNLFFTRQKMIAVRWKPCEPFTVTGDSGSIYYVIQGSLKLPIGIHSLTSSYESSHHKACIIENDGNRSTRLHEVASFACNLYKFIEWFEKENEISVKFFHKN